MARKKRTTVYIPQWMVDMAKARGLVISHVCEEALQHELGSEDNPKVRIKTLQRELAALEVRNNEVTRTRWELENIIKGASGRFGVGVAIPTRFFKEWWESSIVRRDFPIHYHQTTPQIWELLQEHSKNEKLEAFE
ncbi:MAG: hypothetical protein LN412_04210 [Candidatus Thermoplasmatota archaeon]|nr:hypothetical protein [Candidatus Thermoplasmatota archaeon]